MKYKVMVIFVYSFNVNIYVKMISQASYIIKDHLKGIPFIEIVLQYIEKSANTNYFVLLPSVKDKLERKLIENLSYIAEVTLRSEFDKFVANGNTNYDEFIELMIDSLETDYCALDRKLKTRARNFSNHIRNIITRFYKDIEHLECTFNVKNITIVDIDLSLGDEHNGEGTALVYLSDGTKIVYKPRNSSITKFYNLFINWINTKLDVALQTFSVLDCGDYSWLEFISNSEISTEEELQEYYYKTGLLLAITYLLGSKDYHCENVIASAKGPVLIDHETIIQPFLGDSFSNAWEKTVGITSFSVLESSLIAEPDANRPVHTIGYGVKDFSSVVKQNVPVFKGQYIFANNYKEDFIKGFNTAYELFLNLKKELKSTESPIALFRNLEVRFVWRPTFIYDKILRYLRSPQFMTSHEVYRSKLHELLSKLYKRDNMVVYNYILNHEIEQMLNGDIPIFHLGSQEDFLAGNKQVKVFEYSCIDHINYRIDLLSDEHRKEQLRYITRWLNM